MDRREKNEKKRIISDKIDLGSGRYKDNEIDTLHDIATNHERYNGQTRTVKNKFTDWSSDGKYTREEETTYTIKGDDAGVRIEQKYQYHDDDGQSGKREAVFTLGRDILNLLNSFFND